MRFTLRVPDFKDHADEGRWRSYDLETEGDTLEELLDNAIYWQTDQDGGEMGDVPADDTSAQKHIAKWYAVAACKCGNNGGGDCSACAEADAVIADLDYDPKGAA